MATAHKVELAVKFPPDYEERLFSPRPRAGARSEFGASAPQGGESAPQRGAVVFS